MRKIIISFMVLILGFTVIGCGRFNITEPTTEAPTTTNQITTTQATGTNTGTTGVVETTTAPQTTELTYPAEKVTISFWNPLTGADGNSMRQLVSMFNTEFDGIFEVVETYTSETDYYTNLNLLVPMGRGPDVAIMHSYLVQSYANSGIIMPIQDYITESQADINIDDYISAITEQVYFDDELYAVPLDIHTTGLYYNVDLLEQYDIDVPTNRAELIAAATTIQAAEQLAGNTVWGLPISSAWPSEWLYTTSLYQNGGDELTDTLDPAYNTTEGALALDMVADFIHEYELSPLNLSVDQDLFFFETGQAVFHIQGCWMLQRIIESGINFDVIPLSNMFNEDGEDYSSDIAARSHTFVVPSQNGDVSLGEKMAIMTFVKYLGDHSYVWAQAGQIPASNIARATPEYQALPYLSGFGATEDFRLAEASPYYHEAYSPIYSRVTTALLNAEYNAASLINSAVEEAMQLIAAAKE